MTALVPIGEFSRLTHLTVKTLRYYHEVGLLPPYAVADQSGYRRYTVDQLPTALLIGRLRSLKMPLAGVRAVVAAPVGPARDALISAHLSLMEGELDRTRAIVGSLRQLLGPQVQAAPVDCRTVPDQLAVTVGEPVPRSGISDWCGRVFGHLYGTLLAAGGTPTGPGAALYDAPFFADGTGEVTAYIPVSPDGPTGGLGVTTIPGGAFAVAVHSGPFVDFDVTYARLGSHVAEHAVSRSDPIREVYLVSPSDAVEEADFRTEVWWPVSDRPATSATHPTQDRKDHP